MFKESCRAFLYYSNSQSEIDPAHLDCGSDCADCPVRTERAEFEEALVETLTEKTGDKWKAYGLHSLLQTVVDISELAETDRTGWTLKTDRLVRILTSERRRFEKIERWNNRQPETQ